MNEQAAWHSLKLSEVYASLGAGEHGISSSEAGRRLEAYGRNSIETKERASALSIFVDQFKNVLIILLIIAAAVSLFVGELVDGALIPCFRGDCSGATTAVSQDSWGRIKASFR